MTSNKQATENDALVPKDEEDPVLLARDFETCTTIPTIREDALDIVRLGIPIFIARLSFVGMKTTDSALLGHVSREALSASALSDLWTMCTQVLISGRVLSVLVGGAIGAGNPKLAGIYLQVSLVVLSPLAVLVFFTWNLTERVWLEFGSDPSISKMAGYYATVLSFAIPGTLVFGQMTQFFSAQRIMHPMVTSSAIGLVLNLVLGLVFVLGWPIPGWDGAKFYACPIVTASVSYIAVGTLLFVYVWKQQLHAPAWGGWDFKEITLERIKTFSALYFPAAFSTSSDYWRVAVIGAVAAKLGEEEVAVFNTSYRIMWIALTMVGSLAGASAINMSQRLGNMDPHGARQAGYVSIIMSCTILAVFGVGILFHSRMFGMIFTNDKVFLDMFEEASCPFALTLFFMNLAVAIERILLSLGRTSDIFWMGLVGSWVGQVPGVYILTTYWRADLVGLYSGMALGYCLLCLLYGTMTIMSDWNKYAAMAQSRSERKKVDDK